MNQRRPYLLPPRALASPLLAARAAYMVNTMDTVPEEGAGIEPYRVIVGLDNEKFRATAPFIELVATPNALEFRARFGLGRIMGPWRVERAQVDKIYRVRGLIWDGVGIRGKDSLHWIAFPFTVEPLLLTLEEMGYPVDWLWLSRS
jgi:hypothetical protein